MSEEEKIPWDNLVESDRAKYYDQARLLLESGYVSTYTDSIELAQAIYEQKARSWLC